MLKKKPVDAPSLAVASNNLIALRGSKDLFDSLKKFDKIIVKKPGAQQLQFVEGLDHKLSARQKEAMSFNRFLLLLSSNKLDQVTHLSINTYAGRWSFHFWASHTRLSFPAGSGTCASVAGEFSGQRHADSFGSLIAFERRKARKGRRDFGTIC